MNIWPIKYFYLVIVLLIQVPGIVSAQSDFVSSNLPIVVIETNEQEILDEPRIEAQMGVIYNGEGKRNNLNDPFNDYDGRISIEIRGSSSQAYPKKQYRLETQTEDGRNNNVSLMGLPNENDWILYAPYSDKSLIRNVLAYKLSENLGHYAPRTKMCELVLNGEYMGVYVLIEKIKRDNDRVDIAELHADETSGDDVTGGYIIKIDKTSGDFCYGWSTEIAKVYLQNDYPKCEDFVAEHKAYIKNYVQDFENALFADDFTDPVRGYRAYIDIESFVDYFMVNEISKNIDAYRLSTYLYKDKASNDGKLTFGPVWDYNIAFGNADYLGGYETDGLIAHRHPWWDRLLADTSFCNALNSRWHEIRQGPFSNSRIIGMIDSLHTLLGEAQHRNFKQWEVLGNYVWPNAFIGHSYRDEIEFLKSWIVKRLNWLDMNMPGRDIDLDPVTGYDTEIYPNPFNQFFTFSFRLEKESEVSLHLYDASGNQVATIVDNASYGAGQHKVAKYFSPGTATRNSLYIIALEVNGKIVAQEKALRKYW